MARILVVEDDSVVAWHVRETLERLGHFVVLTVSAGEPAIDAAETTRPDLVLMDIRLKGKMDGVTAAEQIYRRFEIPIVFLTAYTDEITLERAKLSAPFGYLVKPLREQELRIAIDLALHRHQLEQEVLQAKQWFATTLTSLGGGVIATDLEGVITFINPAAASLVGWQPADALGQPIAVVVDLIHEATQEPIEPPLRLAIEQNNTVKLPDQLLLRARNGTTHLIENNAAPIRDREGNVIGGVVLLQDRSERRPAEVISQPVQNTTATQLQQTLSQLSIGIACTQVLQRVFEQLSNNTDETQILQATLQELGRSLDADYCWIALDLTEPETAEVRCEYRSDRFQDAPFTLGTLIVMEPESDLYQRLNQGQCWVSPSPEGLPQPYQALLERGDHLILCPLQIDEVTVGEVGILTSRTMNWSMPQVQLIAQVMSQAATVLRQVYSFQNAQILEELGLLNRLKNDFINSVSHELRTPLTNIRMAVEMLRRISASLKRAEAEPEQDTQLLWQRMDRYLQVLQEEWQQEFNLINDLLDFQTTQLTTELLPLTTIDLQQWLPHLCDRFRAQAASHQQTIVCSLPPQLSLITSHLPSLEQIVSELVNNACKYTPPRHTITVTAHVQRTLLNINVTNTGVEIDPSNHDRIFQPFYRIPQAHPWNYSGIGLGLALVKRLLSRLGGDIYVESGDQRTTFVVTLPIG